MKVYRVAYRDNIVSKKRNVIYSKRLNDLPFKENSTFFFLTYIDAVKYIEKGAFGEIVETDLPVELLADNLGVGHYVIDNIAMDSYDAFEFLIDNEELNENEFNYLTDDEVFYDTVNYNLEFSHECFYKEEINEYENGENDKEKLVSLLEKVKEKEEEEMKHILSVRQRIKTIKR